MYKMLMYIYINVGNVGTLKYSWKLLLITVISKGKIQLIIKNSIN